MIEVIKEIVVIISVIGLFSLIIYGIYKKGTRG